MTPASPQPSGTVAERIAALEARVNDLRLRVPVLLKSE